MPAAPLPGASAAGVRASSAGNAVMRGLRGEPFGRHFVLAEVYSAGTMIAWSCRCLLHTADGGTCNKTLNMGTVFTPQEAKRRIQQWCVDGLAMPDEAGGRATHMQLNPRAYDASALLPVEELLRLAEAA